jgi:structural maintenance of chromosome 1
VCDNDALLCMIADHSLILFAMTMQAIMAEKRQKKEQKTEAEKHMALMAQLEEMKIKKILWKLYHLVEDQRKAEDGLSALKKQLSAAEKDVKVSFVSLDRRQVMKTGTSS